MFVNTKFLYLFCKLILYKYLLNIFKPDRAYVSIRPADDYNSFYQDSFR